MRPLTATLGLLLLGAGVGTGAQAQTVDPQLEDPGFDAALPPLSATQPPASQPPAPHPPAEPIAPPPAPDPQAEVELAAPLPPLATFDATPPPVAVAGGDDDEKASEVRYSLAINGLKEVGLAGEFRSFSALVKGDKKGASVAQVQGRADEDVKLAERLLRSQGYYDGAASALVTPVAGGSDTGPGQVDVAITVTPGKRYALGSITVTGPDTIPPRLAYDLLALKAGDPIVATTIETAEARVALRLPERGYPFVEVGQRDIVLDERNLKGDYTLPVTSGPRSSFGAFRTVGDAVFDAKHLSLFPRYKTGELYDSRGVDDVRQALVATGLFSTVAIEPVRTGQPGPALDSSGTETVDLLVRQTKGPWRSLNGSVGYGTGEGIKLQGNFTHRNFFPPEGALSLTAVAGTQEQRVAAAFRRSNAGQRDRAFQAGIDISRENRAAFRAYTANINASLSRVSTPIWQKRWTYSVGAELIATRENRYNFAIRKRDDTNFFIGALPLQLGYDRSDSLLDPTKGFRVTTRFSPEASLQGSFSGYVRALVEGSTYFGLGDNLVLAGRARAGSIQGLARDRIAPSRRLYAGGGGSVRGYGYQALGPLDPNGDPLGGRSLTEFSVEARYRFGGVYGVVPFIDAGQSYTSSTPGLTDLRYGVGIGGRYYTNFGPLRVDIATPLGRRKGDPKVAVYFSIGQAF